MLVCAAGILLNGRGEEMDATKIKELARQIGDSLAEGHIYKIRYSVAERTTDAFYAHKKELIKLLQEAIARDMVDPALNSPTPAMVQRDDSRRGIIASMQKDLKLSKTRDYSCDYSVDGTGFYQKQGLSTTCADGSRGASATTVTVSDGKIMGTFYLDNSQGVIEPATERPRANLEYWTETAYNFSHNTLTECVEAMGELNLTTNAEQLVITGANHFDRNQKTTLELHFDKATLTPIKGILIFYDSRGRVHTVATKTWQFRKYSGIWLPATVVEQYSETDLSGKLNLEKERIFTVLDFDPVPLNAKDEFARILRSNFSIYDEITGEHYLAGNPSQVLDKLSK
jgi:hypothetical protein